MPSQTELTKNAIVFNPELENDFHARVCEQCNSGMNTGCVLNESTSICSKKCLQEYWSIDNNNIDSHIDEAVDDNSLYWTEWDEIDSYDDYIWYAKDGAQGDIKTIIPLLFEKSFKGETGMFDIALSLLKKLAEKDNTFPFSLASTNSENITFSNIIASLSALNHKDKFVHDILKLQQSYQKNNPEHFYEWNTDNTIHPMGKFNSIDDALMDIDDIQRTWVANEADLITLKQEALAVIENSEENMWYALYMNGDIDKLGIYQSLDQATNNHPDDIVYYMNTESLNDFLIQIPIHKPQEKNPIKASINDGFSVDAPNGKIEVEIKDEDGYTHSEHYDTKYEAEHRIGWIEKLDSVYWDDIGNHDMGPELHLVYTAKGLRSLGYFTSGMRIEYDDKGNKMPISTKNVADAEFGEGNWSFIVSEAEARQQRDNLSAIKEVDKAHYVALTTNGTDFIPVHSPGYTDAVHEVEKICIDKNTDFAELETLETALFWLDDLNELLDSHPQYIQPSQFGLDFDISDLNSPELDQWISTINSRHPPKRLHHVSFNDEWDVVDDIDGKEHSVKVSFEDKIEVGINATTEDYYDELLHFLETTVITKDLTAFNFSSNGNNTDIYEIFLEYLQDTVNAQDLTAFTFKGIEVINENPHFIVNEDFSLSCVNNDDVAREEHAHGWFDTDNSVHNLLPALKRLKKPVKNKFTHTPF